MHKSSIILLMISLVVLLLPEACAPTPIPLPPAQEVSPVVTRQSLSTVSSSEESVWQKVVEAGKKERRLIIYDGGIWGADGPVVVGKAFMDTYGINAEFIGGQGADMLERLRTEKRMGNMVADIYISSTLYLVDAKKDGLTSDLSDLPVLREQGVWLTRPDLLDPLQKHFLGTMVTLFPSWINTNLAKIGEEPRSYQDFLSPHWKGRLIITDPRLNSNLYSTMIPLINKGVITTEFIKALGRQEPRLEGSTPKSAMALARGEGALLLSAATINVSTYVAEGAPIKPLVMEEGTTLFLSGAITAIKGQPHPQASRLFINWILTREGQEANARSKKMQGLRQDVADYTPLGARIIPKKVVVSTVDDQAQGASMFLDRTYPKLFEGK